MNSTEIETLYRQATGNRTPHGAQSWAADVLAVTDRTVRRWCSGETSPTALQVARLRIAAKVGKRARQIGDDRRAGRGIWGRLREALGGNLVSRSIEVMEGALEREAAAQSRANAIFPPDARDSLPGGRVDRARAHRDWVNSRARNQDFEEYFSERLERMGNRGGGWLD